MYNTLKNKNKDTSIIPARHKFGRNTSGTSKNEKQMLTVPFDEKS